MSSVKKSKKPEAEESSSETESLSTDSASSSSTGSTSASASSSSLESDPKPTKKQPIKKPAEEKDQQGSESGSAGSSSSTGTGSSSSSASISSAPKKPATPAKKKPAEPSSSSSSELESEHSTRSSSYSTSESSSASLETSSSASAPAAAAKKGGKGKAAAAAAAKNKDEESSSSDLMTDSSDSGNDDSASESSSSSSVRIHKRSSADDDEDEDEDDGDDVEVEQRKTPGIDSVRSPTCSVIYKGNAQSGYRRTTPTPNIVLVDSASSSSDGTGSKSSNSDVNQPTPGVGVAPGDIEMVAVEEDDDDEDEEDEDERSETAKDVDSDDDEEDGEDGKKKKKKKDKKDDKKKKFSIIKWLKKPIYHIIYSIRGTTITFFVFVFFLVFIVFGALALYTAGKFREGDYDLCDDNLNSVVRAMNDDSLKLRELMYQYSEWDDTVAAIHSLNTPNEYYFRQYYESNFLWDGEWITDMKFNLVAFYDVNHTHLFSEYYPPGEGEVQVVKEKGEVPEFFTTDASRKIGGSYHGVIVMPRPMIVTHLPVTYSSQTLGTQGYILFGKEIAPRVKTYAEEISGCITMWIGDEQLNEGEVHGVKEHLSPGYIKTDGEWLGPVHHESKRTHHLKDSKYRICPDVLEFKELPESAAGYIKIADEVDIDGTYFIVRVDLPETMFDTGVPPTGLLFGVTMACILAFVIVGYVYLDLNVLHRLSRIKKFLEKFKREHEEELAEAKLEKASTFRWRKGNKRGSGMGSSGGISDTTGSSDSKAANTSESSTGTGTSDKSSTSGDDKNNERDEIGKLGAALIMNVHAMERDIAVINRDIRVQRRWRRRFELACRLMNFWGGRSKAFPGLYSKDPADPDYALTNYNDMTIDVLLSRPICMEFLRVYAETGEVQENILFLLDVSWLKELERAFDEESDVERRDNIQDIIKDTVTHIFSRYIKSGAPNELNIAGDTMASIRAQEGTYFRGMFSAVIAEIKMLVATDVLIKFKGTAQYAAMSEALDIELHELVAKRPGAFDDYDFKKISSPGKLHDVGIDKDFIQIFQILLMIDNDDAGLKKKGAMHIAAATPTPTPSITPGKDKKSKDKK